MNELEIFAPSIETNCIMPAGEECFLSAHPYDILKNGGSARVPILTGVNKDEGLLSTASKDNLFMMNTNTNYATNL